MRIRFVLTNKTDNLNTNINLNQKSISLCKLKVYIYNNLTYGMFTEIKNPGRKSEKEKSEGKIKAAAFKQNIMLTCLRR